jgi:transcription elongation factor
MKHQRGFSASRLITAALIAASMLTGAALTAARTDSATSGARTPHQQKTSATPPTITFKTLVNFDGTNGAEPGLSPIQGTDGNLYGGTGSGGLHG